MSHINKSDHKVNLQQNKQKESPIQKNLEQAGRNASKLTKETFSSISNILVASVCTLTVIGRAVMLSKNAISKDNTNEKEQEISDKKDNNKQYKHIKKDSENALDHSLQAAKNIILGACHAVALCVCTAIAIGHTLHKTGKSVINKKYVHQNQTDDISSGRIVTENIGKVVLSDLKLFEKDITGISDGLKGVKMSDKSNVNVSDNRSNTVTQNNQVERGR